MRQRLLHQFVVWAWIATLASAGARAQDVAAPAVGADGRFRPVEFETRAVWAIPWGTVRAGEGVKGLTGILLGDRYDLRGDFGLTDSAPVWEGRLAVRLAPDQRVWIQGLQADFSSRTHIGSRIEFDDGRLLPDRDVDTTLRLSQVNLGWETGVMTGDATRLRAGAGAGYAYIIYGFPGIDEEEVRAIVPFVTLGLDAGLASSLSLRADLRVAPTDLPVMLTEPAETRELDLSAAVVWTPSGSVAVSAGLSFHWLYEKYAAEEKDRTSFGYNWVHLRYVGPSLGVTVLF